MDSDRAGWAPVIRMQRERLEMTQQQLAAAAGVSLKTVSNLENESLTPQRGTLRKVREALGLSSDLSVAADQAEHGTWIEKRGLGRALPTRRTGLDGLIWELENKVLDLEDRVAALEERQAEDTPESLVASRRVQSGPRHGLEDIANPQLTRQQKLQILTRAGVPADNAALLLGAMESADTSPRVDTVWLDSNAIDRGIDIPNVVRMVVAGPSTPRVEAFRSELVRELERGESLYQAVQKSAEAVDIAGADWVDARVAELKAALQQASASRSPSIVSGMAARTGQSVGRGLRKTLDAAGEESQDNGGEDQA